MVKNQVLMIFLPGKMYPATSVVFHSIDNRRDRRDEGVMEWPGPHCEDDSACAQICDDIFSRRRFKDECTDLSTVSVGKIKKVVDVLNDPDEDNLENMELEALRLLLSINVRPLEKAVDGWNPGKQKNFLAWLAQEPMATEIIAKFDNFEIFEELFGSNKTNIISKLNQSIEARDSFVEVALEEGNETALEWIQELFGEQCDPVANEDQKQGYEECIFKQY